MSEINKLNGFNSNYGFYQKDDSESSVKKEAQPEQAKAPETKSVSPEKVFDAMNVLAQQNAYNVQGRTLVNPKDYLSEERISSIENSIAEFEKVLKNTQMLSKTNSAACLVKIRFTLLRQMHLRLTLSVCAK